MPPQDVAEKTRLLWWHRWAMWGKAKRARELWQTWRNNRGQMGTLSKDDDAIMLWAMVKDDNPNKPK